MKRKILIFIDWYLPGYKAGGPIRSVANLVEHLVDEFDFLIVTRDTDYIEHIPYPNVKSNEWNTLSDGVQVYYFSQDQLTRNNVRNLIKRTDFDCIYLNGIYSLYFTLIPLMYLRKRYDQRVVIAGRGMLAESALDVKKTKKQIFIKAVKFLKLFDNVVFHATNEVERMDIQKVIGEKVQVMTAGNLFQKMATIELPKREKRTDMVRLVNVARIAPEKNLLYALKVLQFTKENIEFDFYGPVYDQEYWTECKLILDELPHNVKANYKGSIDSEKVLDMMRSYHFMFMPTLGENFGHIILQAFSIGCPVIISDQTPWRNLDSKNIGWDINLEKKEEFADIIDACARMASSDYDEMSKKAFSMAKQYSSNKEIVEQNRLLFL